MKLHRTLLTAALTLSLAVPMAAVISPASGAPAPAVAQVKYEPVASGSYSLDPAHSLIGFGVKHFEIAVVEGRFKDFTGTIDFDAQDITKSKVSFTAKIASLDTEVEARDKHLMSADFFEVEKYPEMNFRSTRITRGSDGGYVLHGDLTMKGVTKHVSLPFTMTGAVRDPWGNTRFGVHATTTLNRRDYGIDYGNAFAGGGMDVANEVTVELRLEAVKPIAK